MKRVQQGFTLIESIVHNDVNTLNRTTPTNLIANGSFETGGPSTGNPVSYFWTRPCNNVNVPPGWASNSDIASYGWWGYFQSGDGNQYQNPVCNITLQTLIDAQMLAPAGNSNNLLYFGNYELTAGPPVPAYNAATGEYIPRAGVAAANTAINWVLGVLTPTSPLGRFGN